VEVASDSVDVALRVVEGADAVGGRGMGLRNIIIVFISIII